MPAVARSAPSGSPLAFGAVFEAAKASIVQVEVSAPPADRKVWATGFAIGARGEVVFGAPQQPPTPLRVRTPDGAEHSGTLLGYLAGVQVGIARISAPPTPGLPHPLARPLRVARKPGLLERRWVLVIKHDALGHVRPYAGLVAGLAPALRPSAKSPVLGPPPTFTLRRLEAPGSPGSPVLSGRGELVGVAVAEGRRETRAVPIESLLPFLREAMLAESR